MFARKKKKSVDFTHREDCTPEGNKEIRARRLGLNKGKQYIYGYSLPFLSYPKAMHTGKVYILYSLSQITRLDEDNDDKGICGITLRKGECARERDWSKGSVVATLYLLILRQRIVDHLGALSSADYVLEEKR